MIFKTVCLLLMVNHTLAFSVLESICFYRDFKPFGRTYLCSVTSTIHDSEGIGFLASVATHTDGARNFDVSAFRIVSRREVSTIPTNLGSLFINLKILVCFETSLRTISAKDLKQFQKLELLDLSGNYLVNLDGDLFKSTPNMKYIFFRSNSLHKIDENLLDSLKKLEWADFRWNPCVDFFGVFGRRDANELKKKFKKNCSLSMFNDQQMTRV